MLETYRTFTPVVPATAWVHPSAVVSGDVELSDGVSIWPTAVLRGDQGPIRIGPRSNIQDGSVVHNTGGLSTTRVGARVTVGHRVILHGCVVEDDVLIGMGAIVMDNAHVGTGSIVGAGALVTAGTVIPPGSLVLGSPARVARAVHAKQTEWIAHSWTTYYERCTEELAARQGR
jgi:carbonic anhydrase/acetyltransferase-like protein (isoleucine patch superfamily)